MTSFQTGLHINLIYQVVGHYHIMRALLSFSNGYIMCKQDTITAEGVVEWFIL